MITAAFFTLLILSAISVNRMLIESAETDYKTEAYAQAIGIAQELMNEATKKKFDENAVSPGPQRTSAFTVSSRLGPDGSGEAISPWPDHPLYQSPTKYDDVDDYHGYRRTANGSTMSGFEASAQVYYVMETSPHTRTTSRTYMKRIDVKVRHDRYLDSLKISRFVTY